MSKPNQKLLNRRDFLKGVGLAGGGALLSILGDREVIPAQAKQPSTSLNSIVAAPPLAAYFVLEVAGYSLFETFDTCASLGSESETVEFQTGSDTFIRHRPGRNIYPNITLERELTTNMAMWDWQQAAANTENYKFNGSIIARDDQGTPIAQWDFINGWPCEVIAELGRSDSEPYTPVIRERTILAVESLERVE